MNFMEVLFGKKAPELDRLIAQAEKLDALHEVLQESHREIEEIKKTLVSKANGALYPHLSAGIKLRDST